MNGRIVLGVLLVLVVIVGVAGIGAYAYNLGVAQALVGGEKLVAPGPGFAPHLLYGRPFFFRPFGFGFLGCLFPLLAAFLVLALLRGLFWHGRWGCGHHGHWEHGAPPMFEEWHHKAHEPQAADK